MINDAPPTLIRLRDRKQYDPKAGVRCPSCKKGWGTVKNSGQMSSDTIVGLGRQRTCFVCGHKYRTVELTEPELRRLLTQAAHQP